MSKVAEEETNNKGSLRTYKDAVAIITGGASGIGKALAFELACQGAQAIVILDRQVDVALLEVVPFLRILGAKEAHAFEVDVRNYDDVERCIKETKETFGRIDYLFNNAGLIVSATVEKMDHEDFDYVLDVNVRGVANGVHAVYPIMKEQGFGHIINTSSVAGLVPLGENCAAYGTSKYAVTGMSLNLRIEGARHGIRVSALCPGVIDTPILVKGGKFGKDLTGHSPEKIKEMIAKFRPMDADKFAKDVLKLVAKNKPIIIVPGFPWKLWCSINRLFPQLGLYLARKQSEKMSLKLAPEEE